MQTESRVVAEKLLKAKLGEGESLGGSDRSAVWRVPVLDTELDLPQTVVVKQVQESDFGGGGIDSQQRFIRDLAALQLINSIFDDRPPVPRLYAFDNEQMLFIMEDIQDAQGFHLDLMGDNAYKTEQRLKYVAQTLGRIHAASTDKANEYQQHHQALGELKPFGFNWLDKGWSQVAEASGIPLPDDIDRAYNEIKRLAQDAGKWSVLTHSDLCPDNILVNDERAYFIDFEVSAYLHAAYDACYPRLMMPTCWCAAQFPEKLIREFETIYRTEFANARPEIEDDLIFEGFMADGMLLALSITFNWVVKQALDDWRVDFDGLATARQRLIYRLNSFYETTKKANRHQILGDYAARAADVLSNKWAISEIALYIPFRN